MRVVNYAWKLSSMWHIGGGLLFVFLCVKEVILASGPEGRPFEHIRARSAFRPGYGLGTWSIFSMPFFSLPLFLFRTFFEGWFTYFLRVRDFSFFKGISGLGVRDFWFLTDISNISILPGVSKKWFTPRLSLHSLKYCSETSLGFPFSLLQLHSSTHTLYKPNLE